MWTVKLKKNEYTNSLKYNESRQKIKNVETTMRNEKQVKEQTFKQNGQAVTLCHPEENKKLF